MSDPSLDALAAAAQAALGGLHPRAEQELAREEPDWNDLCSYMGGAPLFVLSPDLARGLVAAVDALRAAEARRDALAAAVREERDAADAYDAACAALDSDACAVASVRMDAATTATDALLSGAAADVVRAGVVPPRAPSTCRSDDDGDCRWNRCPQRLDGEPWVTGRVCPLTKED